MALQETTILINHTFSLAEFIIVLATSNTQVAKPIEITKVNWKKKIKEIEGPREYAGVGIMYHKDYEQAVLYYRQFSGRSVVLGLRTNSQPLIINSILAPHNATTAEGKQQFWKQLTLEAKKHKNAIHITLGDTNTRWHCRLPGEEDILGPHIFGRGEEYLRGKMKDGDNREFAIGYLRSTGKVAINTFFQKTRHGNSNI